MIVFGAAIAACTTSAGGSSSAPSGAAKEGGTAVFAEAPGSTPNYILPMLPLAYFNPGNAMQFQPLMWRPLYWFGDGNQVVLNQKLSLAYPPVFRSGDTVVDIKLKPYKWSDGKPVTSRDVTFYFNMYRAEKAIEANYIPGYFPDNVKSITTPSSQEFVLTLTGPVNPTWFTLNELSQVVPLPEHAWDKTSATGPVGNFDTTAFKFLNSQSLDMGTYASNPLWQVVDGPWRLSQFNSNGYAVFVPNKNYSGPVKPHLAKFVEQPFTSEEAEYNALRAGQVTYGYVPVADANQISLLKSTGDQVAPWTFWSMEIAPINFHNPVNGPAFSQLYIRQAMESVINQSQYISAIFNAYAVPDYGPVPAKPVSPYLSSLTSKPVYPYDPKHAAELLTSHGWKVGANGVAACVSPGTGTGQCGAGIRAGQQLSFQIMYPSGVPEVNSEMEAFKSSLSTVGIRLTLTQKSLNQLLAALAPCAPSQAACSWQLAYTPWSYFPNNYPSGEVGFKSDAVGDWGSYSSKEMDQLIEATTTQDSMQVFHNFVDYAAQQLPVLYLPVPAYQVSAISGRLGGALPQQVDGIMLNPENWYFTK